MDASEYECPTLANWLIRTTGSSIEISLYRLESLEVSLDGEFLIPMLRLILWIFCQ
jgi:hypothetical protein